MRENWEVINKEERVVFFRDMVINDGSPANGELQ